VREQLELRLSNPPTVDVDGRFDPKCEEIQYLGRATMQFDGTWRCLANVAGALCLVEVKITMEPR
jgi:hypothetical protein